MNDQQSFDDDRLFMEEHVGALTDIQWELIREFFQRRPEVNQIDREDTFLGMHMPVDWLVNKWRGGIKGGAR